MSVSDECLCRDDFKPACKNRDCALDWKVRMQAKLSQSNQEPESEQTPKRPKVKALVLVLSILRKTICVLEHEIVDNLQLEHIKGDRK